MKSLILAAALSMLAAPALSAPTTHPTSFVQTEKSAGDVAQDRENYCLQVLNGQITMEQASKDLDLTTSAQKRDFAVDCIILMDGIQAGVQGAQHHEGPSDDGTSS